MSVNINFQRGLEKEQIDIAVFSLCDEKSLALSVVDDYEADDVTIIGQSLKITIKDERYGGEELFVELDINDGKDLVKLMQRLLRQIGSFKPDE